MEFRKSVYLPVVCFLSLFLWRAKVRAWILVGRLSWQSRDGVRLFALDGWMDELAWVFAIRAL